MILLLNCLIPIYKYFASLIRKQFILLCLVLGLSACDDFKAPIEADDFGFPKMTIKAAGKSVKGQQATELSEWEFSGYTYDGSLAVIMVYNPYNYQYVWSSWFGNGEGTLTESLQSSSTPYCCVGGTYNKNSKTCTTPRYCAKSSAQFETIANAPCIFSQGQGLYMLLTDPANTSITDPNSYTSVNRSPAIANFFTLGLWQYTGMYQNGILANGYIGGYVNNVAVSNSKSSSNTSGASVTSATTYTDLTIPQANVGGKLYFKILDNYYDDNSGFYYVSLKNGFSSTITPPIAMVISLITTQLNNASESIYKNITNNQEFHKSLRAALSLYIIIHGILYIAGILQMSQKELVMMTMKLVLVIQLLTTDTSWTLFNTYFFNFFTGGLNEIINIITANISGAMSGTGATGLTFFDAMFNLLFSYETTMKIIALIFSVDSGIVVVAIIYASFALFIICLAKGLILYLLAYIAISLIISLAPIFISFMLFKRTKSIFDNWLNQLIAYFFQPLFVFAALAMMGQNVINQMYKLLGFKVCYTPWITTPSPSNATLVKMWQICPFNSATATKATIPVPGYGFWDPNNPTTFYPPYSFQASRYIDLPFLAPAVGNSQNDQALIEAFNGSGGYISALNLPMLTNSFTLLLTTYLIFLFNDMIPGLAQGITGGGAAPSMNKAANSGVQQIGNAMRGAAKFTAASISEGSELLLSKTSIGRGLVSVLEAKNKFFKDAYDSVNERSKDNPNNKILNKVSSNIYNAGYGIARFMIPPGSLKLTKAEAEIFKKESGAQDIFSDFIKKKLEDKAGITKIKESAAAFDNRVDSYKEGIKERIKDKIGARFDNAIKQAHSKNPLNVFKKGGKSRTAIMDNRSEDVALLRRLGILDSKGVYGENKAKLSERDIKKIETNLSDKDIKGMLNKASDDDKAKIAEFRKKIAEEKKKVLSSVDNGQTVAEDVGNAGKVTSNSGPGAKTAQSDVLQGKVTGVSKKGQVVGVSAPGSQSNIDQGRVVGISNQGKVTAVSNAAQGNKSPTATGSKPSNNN
jgi:type IV secretory pathway VirB6-like protein